MAKLYLGTREVTPTILQQRYGVNVENFLGSTNANGVLLQPSGNFDVSFDGVTDVQQRALSNKFNYTKVKNVNFPDLIALSGNYACFCAFYGCSLVSVSFPKLATVSGTQAMGQIFENSGLQTITFPALTTISGNNAMNRAFGYLNIRDIYFPALTTNSFPTYTTQFSGMFSGSGSSSNTINVHFPSNLQSTIANLTGYPNFGGTAGYINLLFDLEATE